MTHILLTAHWCHVVWHLEGMHRVDPPALMRAHESGLRFPLCQSPSLSENFLRDPKGLWGSHLRAPGIASFQLQDLPEIVASSVTPLVQPMRSRVHLCCHFRN